MPLIKRTLTAIIGIALFDSCTTTENNVPKPVSIPVIEVARQNTPLHKEYVADIEAIKNVKIYARVKGYLEDVYVDEGQEVRKGQLLFSINDAEYSAALNKARANLTQAIAEAKEMELERDKVKKLVQQQVISSTELEVAQARLAAANARIEEAKSAVSNAGIQLNHTNIYAPFDGVVDRIPYKTGSLIDEGTELTTISDLEQVFTYFNLSENEYLAYVKEKDRTSNEVDLILADGSAHVFKGKIETMEGQFNESTGSIAFRARFANPDKLLKHGSTGTIRLTNVVKDALLIPQKSVFEIQDKHFVFVVNDKNQINMRAFKPSTRFSNYYVIESGLAEQEKIVFEGIQNVKEGMFITPENFPADSLLALSLISLVK